MIGSKKTCLQVYLRFSTGVIPKIPFGVPTTNYSDLYIGGFFISERLLVLML